MPGTRRNKFIEIDGQLVTRKSRPWEASGELFEQMADATLKVNRRFLQIVTAEMVTILNQNGGRYRLRGSRGNRVPLEGKADVKAFQTRDAGLKVVGKVKGIPEGFWNIVEYGRGGRYLVYSRYGKGGKQRVSKKGKTMQNYLTTKQVQRRFNQQGTLADLKPILTPYGPRQYAMPGPHGPIGNPWRRSMDASAALLETELTTQQTQALIKTWKGGR